MKILKKNINILGNEFIKENKEIINKNIDI